MLRDIAYDGMDVVNIIKLGIRIVGALKRTGIWETSDEKMPRQRSDIFGHQHIQLKPG